MKYSLDKYHIFRMMKTSINNKFIAKPYKIIGLRDFEDTYYYLYNKN